MKHSKFICLLLVLALTFGLIAGCSSDEAEDTPRPTSTPTATKSPSEGTDEPTEPEGITFPLEERVEFSMFVGMWESNLRIFETFDDHPVTKILEPMTNVHINYTHPAAGSEQETFNLMLVSQEYDDVFTMMHSSQSATTLHDNGMILNLNDLVEEYMPNMYSYIVSEPAMLKDAKDDNGNILLMYRIEERVPLNWAGLAVREDLLNKAGLPLPETYDDWEQVGAAFLDMGIEKPIFIPNSGSFTGWSTFESGFGVGSRLYCDGDVVKYGPMEPGYKDYITTMKSWYDKGYIHKGFVGETFWGNGLGMPDTTDLYNGIVGGCVLTSSHVGSLIQDSGLAANEDMYYAGVYTPVKNKGDKVNYSTLQGSGRISTGFAISSDVSEELCEIIMKYYDYLYTDDGIILANYGVEGESFVYENGEPVYTDIINTSAADGVNYFHVYDYAYGQYPMIHTDKERTLPRPADIIPNQEKWHATDTDLFVVPKITMTADESADSSSIINDANTYANEMTVKFIIGTESLDNYDVMIETLTGMGIKDALAIYQVALDRYNAR